MGTLNPMPEVVIRDLCVEFHPTLKKFYIYHLDDVGDSVFMDFDQLEQAYTWAASVSEGQNDLD